MARILVTGASGCIGHYISEALIQHTTHDLFLVVRDPAKLQLDVAQRPGIQVVTADLRQADALTELLPTIQQAVLTATMWGGTEETFDLNVTKTLALIQGLDPQVCEQVLYFSTASLLSRAQTLLPEAGTLGTDYIRSKYECFQRLQTLAEIPKVVTIFPTLVFGGDQQKPMSHLSAGIPEVLRWIDLIKFVQLDGSFHFLHADDIARVICHLVEHPEAAPADQLVLGNPTMTVEAFIQGACLICDRTPRLRIPLTPWLINLVIKLFNIQMAPWDRFCLDYRHFNYPHPINPATFGLPGYCTTIPDLLRLTLDTSNPTAIAVDL